MQCRIKIQSWLCVLVKKSAPDDAKIPRHFWDLIDHISSRITEKKYGGKKGFRSCSSVCFVWFLAFRRERELFSQISFWIWIFVCGRVRSFFSRKWRHQHWKYFLVLLMPFTELSLMESCDKSERNLKRILPLQRSVAHLSKHNNPPLTVYRGYYNHLHTVTTDQEF